nr:ABC transporter ATP-binding protein [Amphibacillus cookii]
MVEVENLSKVYQMGEVKIDALKNVSFSIDKGEFVVVLGASGAGKSTLLNILGGMDKATSGKVMISDEDINTYSDKESTIYRKEKVGFVFQFYNLINNLTALENVEFASGSIKDKLNAESTLKKVGLEERIHNFPAQLSGGEQQRVSIARAVAKNPDMLLCDEPTGALDHITGKSVLQLLLDIHQDYNKTIIVITHNQAISYLADKVIKMKSGGIEDIIKNADKKNIDEVEW